jgi:hypothetical protein
MSNAFVKIKMCYVHNHWYDISCATLYLGHLILIAIRAHSVHLAVSRLKTIAHTEENILVLSPHFGYPLLNSISQEGFSTSSVNHPAIRGSVVCL